MGLKLKARLHWSGSDEPIAEYAFDQERLRLGRSAGADVQLPHVSISSTHASIRFDRNSYLLTDENSTNGTYLNGVRCVPQRPKPIAEGDVIRIGAYLIDVAIEPIAQATSIEGTRELALRLLRGEALKEDLSHRPHLRILNGPRRGDVIALVQNVFILGRSDACEISLPDADCSREHARLRFDGSWWLSDLESKNGVFVGTKRLTQTYALKDRDEIRIGETVLCFDDPVARDLEQMVTAEVELYEVPSESVLEEGEGKDRGDEGAHAAPPPPPGALEGLAAQASAPLSAQAGQAGQIAPPVVEEPALTLQARPRSDRVDLFVYILAGAIIAMSLAGLWWLFR